MEARVQPLVPLDAWAVQHAAHAALPLPIGLAEVETRLVNRQITQIIGNRHATHETHLLRMARTLGKAELAAGGNTLALVAAAGTLPRDKYRPIMIYYLSTGYNLAESTSDGGT